MGAFNEWVRGSFWKRRGEKDGNRGTEPEVMVGAAKLTRAGWLRTQGVPLSPMEQGFVPRRTEELSELIQG